MSEAALQEGVDAIGISGLSYDHVLIPSLNEKLCDKGLNDIPVIVGCIIPKDDEIILKDAGLAKIFPPGSKLDEIKLFFKDIVPNSRSKKKKWSKDHEK